MRIVINGWFLDQPHTGSGQYTRQLVKQLPKVAPQHEYAVIVPLGSSFDIVDLSANADVEATLAQQLTAYSEHPLRKLLTRLSKKSRHQMPEPLPDETQTAGEPGTGPVHVAPDFSLQRPSSNWRKLLFEQSIVPRAAAAYRADLLHVPYWAPPLSAKMPIVVTIHDLIPLLLPEYRGGPFVRMYTSLVRAAARGADLILTDSKASRRDIIRHLAMPEARVRTIYLAADPKFSTRIDPIDTAALRQSYDLPDAYVLYLGGFDVRKNIETLLQVYTWAEDALGEYFPLVVAGELPDRHDAFFRDPRIIAKQLEVEKAVRFIGPVAEEDKVALYQQARAFLFASSCEGFGLPPLEALACGVPVVGSNAASIPEIVGDAGMLVDPLDARAMAGALIAVATDPQLHDDLAERAVEQAARFSWEKCARETAQAYEDVLRET